MWKHFRCANTCAVRRIIMNFLHLALRKHIKRVSVQAKCDGVKYREAFIFVSQTNRPAGMPFHFFTNTRNRLYDGWWHSTLFYGKWLHAYNAREVNCDGAGCPDIVWISLVSMQFIYLFNINWGQMCTLDEIVFLIRSIQTKRWSIARRANWRTQDNDCQCHS